MSLSSLSPTLLSFLQIRINLAEGMRTMARYSDSGYSGISMGTQLNSMKSNTFLEIS